MQIAEFLRVSQEGLLQLEVLLLQLRDYSAIHLAQEADSRLVRLNQPILLLLEKLLQVAELLVVDRCLALEDEV